MSFIHDINSDISVEKSLLEFLSTSSSTKSKESIIIWFSDIDEIGFQDLDLEPRLIFTMEFEFSICGSLLPDYWWVNWILVEFLSQFFVRWAWWWVELACERTFLRFIEHWTVEIMDDRTLPKIRIVPDSGSWSWSWSRLESGPVLGLDSNLFLWFCWWRNFVKLKIRNRSKIVKNRSGFWFRFLKNPWSGHP